MNRWSGIFFHQQASAIEKTEKVGVLAYLNLSLKQRFKQHFWMVGPRWNGNKLLYYSLAIPGLQRLNLGLRTFVMKRALRRYINRFGKPDMIHVHCAEAGQVARWAKIKHGIPFIVTEHLSRLYKGDLSDYYLKYVGRVYHDASRCVAVSHGFRHVLEQRFDQEFVVIPNMVDCDTFTIANDKHSYSDDVDFVQVGGLNKNKNHSSVIRAIKILADQGYNITLRIIGDGEERQHLQELTESLGLSRRIHFLGNCSQKEVRDALQRSDYLVLSSYKETFGVVIIEAMCCGLPVLSTKTNGAIDLIEEGENGYLCEPDSESISTGMVKMIRHTWNTMMIRDHVSGNYSASVVTKQIKNLYRKTIGNDLDA
jgi:glycosyltransferase involved in cell wall biosynthesis